MSLPDFWTINSINVLNEYSWRLLAAKWRCVDVPMAHMTRSRIRNENRCAIKMQICTWLSVCWEYVNYLSFTWLYFPTGFLQVSTGFPTEMTTSAGRCPISTLPLLQTRRISDDHVRQLLLVKAHMVFFAVAFCVPNRGKNTRVPGDSKCPFVSQFGGHVTSKRVT